MSMKTRQCFVYVCAVSFSASLISVSSVLTPMMNVSSTELRARTVAYGKRHSFPILTHLQLECLAVDHCRPAFLWNHSVQRTISDTSSTRAWAFGESLFHDRAEGGKLL